MREVLENRFFDDMPNARAYEDPTNLVNGVIVRARVNNDDEIDQR